MSSKPERYVPPLRAEDLVPSYLPKLPVEIDPLGPAYKGITESVKRVSEGVENSAWFAVIGYYGSGKTLLLRRIAHDVVKTHKKVIPIYFYLGNKEEILLLDSLGRYISELEAFIQGRAVVQTRIHGEPKDWVETGRLKALKDAYDAARAGYDVKKNVAENVRFFFEAMRRLNEHGYVPLVILDEFERLVYTGEGVTGSKPAVINLHTLSEQYLELTRGHVFRGVGIVALTDDMPKLLEKAVAENREHVRAVEEVAGVRYRELKFASPNIVYSGTYRLKWTFDNLEILCKRLNIILPVDFIRVLSEVLPTPRALLTIAKKTYETGVEAPGKKDLFRLFVARVEEFVNALKTQKTSGGRPLIYPTSMWDERFRKLLEEGYYVVRSDELAKVGKLFKPDVGDDKARSFARNVVNSLADYGLYEKVGKEYVLRRELMAFFLEIERLPTGQTATLEDVVTIVKNSIEERRKRAEKYRQVVKKTKEGEEKKEKP